MTWSGFYNAFPESVEEKTNAEQWEFSRTTLQLTLQTVYTTKRKTSKQYIDDKKIANDILNITRWAGHRPKIWDLLTPNGGSFAHYIRPVTCA